MAYRDYITQQVNKPLLNCGVPQYEMPIIWHFLSNKVPDRFDHLTLFLMGVDNSCDVPCNQALDCAISTIEMWLDQYDHMDLAELTKEGYEYVLQSENIHHRDNYSYADRTNCGPGTG